MSASFNKSIHPLAVCCSPLMHKITESAQKRQSLYFSQNALGADESQHKNLIITCAWALI